jgi:hypothetical protein
MRSSGLRSVAIGEARLVKGVRGDVRVCKGVCEGM